MKRADLTLFIDGAGKEHVAIVTDQHPDGTVDLAVLKPTLRNVPRSAIGSPHSAFDIDAPREELALEETIEPEKVAKLRPFPGAQEKFFNKGAAAGQSLFQGDVIGLNTAGQLEHRPHGEEGKAYTGLAGAESESKQEEGSGAVETSPDQGPVSGG